VTFVVLDGDGAIIGETTRSIEARAMAAGASIRRPGARVVRIRNRCEPAAVQHARHRAKNERKAIGLVLEAIRAERA
jgi:hypothetical protein